MMATCEHNFINKREIIDYSPDCVLIIMSYVLISISYHHNELTSARHVLISSLAGNIWVVYGLPLRDVSVTYVIQVTVIHMLSSCQIMSTIRSPPREISRLQYLLRVYVHLLKFCTDMLTCWYNWR